MQTWTAAQRMYVMRRVLHPTCPWTYCIPRAAAPTVTHILATLVILKWTPTHAQVFDTVGLRALLDAPPLLTLDVVVCTDVSLMQV